MGAGPAARRIAPRREAPMSDRAPPPRTARRATGILAAPPSRVRGGPKGGAAR